MFDEAERDFSHGCIRVENPAALAEYVLGPQGWEREKIETKLESSEPAKVKVESPIAVYIIYLTAFPTWDNDDERKVRFYPDLYQQDQKFIKGRKTAKMMAPD